MTIVPVQVLVPDDLPHLGDNLTAAIREDHEELAAINRSLELHDEEIDPDVLSACESEHTAG